MKHQSYYDRSLKAADPRYARIFEKMGYGRRAMHAASVIDDIPALRAEYERVIGKKPFNGWKADQLREKIAAAMAEG